MNISDYFTLTPGQQQQFDALGPLYEEWNARINVISRKDIGHLYDHHVLHSLAIAKVIRFQPATRILDFGTGGGFPGIPLAILFPDCQFRLIDGTGKKIRVVQEVASAIGLDNVEAVQRRGEDEKDKFDFIVSRAVMPLPDLMRIVRKNISKQQHNAMPNGVLCLKGGSVDAEVKPFRHIVDVPPIDRLFQDDWFKQKYVIYVPA